MQPVHSPIDCSPPPPEPPPGGRIVREPLATDPPLELLLVPTGGPAGIDESDADPLADAATAWVTAAPADDPAPPVSVPLYGLLVVWTPRRAAVVADAGRLDAARGAVVAFSHLETELGRIEREVESLLAATVEDARFAFTFTDRDSGQSDRLAAHHRRAVAARIGLARIAADVRRPAPHPPTLAGQIGERLRDRLRLADRLEAAEGKAEIAEQVYATCGQRSSEFLIGRRQMGLEWIIILLLAIETVLLAVELLSSSSS
jgi:hypothetical protein